jgi:hypothetical protein
VVLFGEYHEDEEEIRGNVLDACKLIDLGIVACAGVEEDLEPVHDWPESQLQHCQRASEMRAQNQGDEGMINHLRTTEGKREFKRFGFGKALRLLRPDLPLRQVEDRDIRKRMWNTVDVPGLSQQERLDHPIHREREKKFVENLLSLLRETRTTKSRAAILNTGSHHSNGAADQIRSLGLNYVYLAQPNVRRGGSNEYPEQM